MANLYETTGGLGLLIYSFGKQIFLRQKIGERFSRPITIANDYKIGLGHTVYKNCLYYSYINENDHLIIKRTTQPDILYINEGLDICVPPVPCLISFAEKLLVIFQNNLHELKVLFPLEDRPAITIPEKINPDHTVTVWSGKYCVFIEIVGEDYYHLLEINSAFQIIDLESENKALRDSLSQKKQEIQNLNSTISDVARQYSELMDVAKQYRNEAIKWRNKFIN